MGYHPEQEILLLVALAQFVFASLKADAVDGSNKTSDNQDYNDQSEGLLLALFFGYLQLLDCYRLFAAGRFVFYIEEFQRIVAFAAGDAVLYG